MKKMINICGFIAALLLVAASATAAYDPAYQWHDGYYGTPDSNTMLLVHFDEGTGTVVADSSGQGNNGTCTGAVLPGWNTGRFGTAIELTGDTVMGVVIPDSNSLDLGSDYTIEAWIYPYSDIYPDYFYQVLVHKYESYSVQYYDDNRSFKWWCWDDLAFPPLQLESGLGTIQANSWYHIAVVWDQSATEVKTYVNGQLVANETYYGFYGALNNANPVTIGAFDPTDPTLETLTTFNGLIDEVRISNCVRTFVTQDTIPHGGNFAPESLDSGLVLLWDNPDTSMLYGVRTVDDLSDPTWPIVDFVAGLGGWVDQGDEDRLSPLDPSVTKRFYKVDMYK